MEIGPGDITPVENADEILNGGSSTTNNSAFDPEAFFGVKKKTSSVNGPSGFSNFSALPSGIGQPKSSQPQIFTEKGAQDNKTPEQIANEKLQQQLNSAQQAYFAFHPELKNQLSIPERKDELHAASKKSNNLLQLGIKNADENFVRPLAKATADFVFSPLHGAYQFYVDTQNKILSALTGENIDDPNTQDVYSETAKSLNKFGDAYGQKDNYSIDQRVSHGIASAVPMVLGTLLMPESDVSELGWLGANLPEVTQAVTKGSQLGTLLGATQGFNAYGSSRDNGNSVSQSLKTGAEEGAKGFGSGLLLEGQSLLSQKLGGALVSKLSKMGLVRDGGLTDEAIKGLTVATVFGSTSALQDAVQGKPINVNNAIDNAATGLAFHFPSLLKGAIHSTEHLNDLEKAQTQEKVASFMNAPSDYLVSLKNEPISAVDLQAKAIKLAAEAEKEEDPTQKNSLLMASVAMQRASGLKGMTEDVIDHGDKMIEAVKNADFLNDPEKAQIIQKLSDIRDNNNPIAETKQQLGNKILENNSKIEQLQQIIATSKNPVDVSTAKAHLENAMNLHSEYNNALDNLTKGEINGTITHQNGAIIDNSQVKQNPIEPINIQNADQIATHSNVIDTPSLEQIQAGEQNANTSTSLPNEAPNSNNNPNESNENPQPTVRQEPLTSRLLSDNKIDISDPENKSLIDFVSEHGDDETARFLSENGIDTSKIGNVDPDHLNKILNSYDASANNPTNVNNTEPDNSATPQPGNSENAPVEKETKSVESIPNLSGVKTPELQFSTKQGKKNPIDPINISNDSNIGPYALMQDPKYTTAAGIQVSPIIDAELSKKTSEIFRDVSRNLKATITYKKIPNEKKRMLGVFDPTGELIKLKNRSDLPVLTHEIGHLVDERLGFVQLMNENEQAQKELKDLSVGGSKPSKNSQNPDLYRSKEGFAEFILNRTINPDATAEKFPELTKQFDKLVDKDVQSALKTLSDDIRTYDGATVSQQMSAQVGRRVKQKMSLGEKIDNVREKKITLMDALTGGEYGSSDFKLNFGDKIARAVFDAHSPLYKVNKILEDLGARENDDYGNLGSSHFKKMVRTFAGIGSKIDTVFKNGLIDGQNNYVLDEVTGQRKTFPWIFGPFAKDENFVKNTEELSNYMIAYRTLTNAEKFGRKEDITGIGAGLESDHSKAVRYMNEFNNFPAELQEQIKEGARRYRSFSNSILDYGADKGMISKELNEFLKTTGVDYVNLTRNKKGFADPEMESELEKKMASGNIGEIIKMSKGGNDEINDVYGNLAHLANTMIREADKNELRQLFLKPFRDEAGSSSDEKNPRLSDIGFKTLDTDGVKVFFDGKAEYYKLHPDIERALKSGDKTADLPPVLTFAAKGLRFGTTIVPAFQIRNILKDYQEVVLKSETGQSVYNDIASLFSGEHDHPSDSLYELFGGDQAGHYIKSKDSWNQKIQDIIDESVGNKNVGIIPGVKHAYELYKNFLEKGERLNRTPEFDRAYKLAKSKGLDDYQAGVHAAYEARDLMDFAVFGEWMKYVNQIIPFSNAGVQGWNRLARAAKEGNRVNFTIRALLSMALPAAITRIWIANQGLDQKYDQSPSYMKDLFNYIGDFGGKSFYIPRPYEAGLIGATTSRLMDQFIYKNPNAWDGFRDNAFNVLNPIPGAPKFPIVGTLGQIASNHEDFRGNQIVPDYEKDLDIYNKKGADNASNISKALSKIAYNQFGKQIDPRYTDFAVRDMLGNLGDLTLRASNQFNQKDRGKLGLAQFSGVTKDEYSLSSAKDVQYALSEFRRAGMTQNSDYKNLIGKLKEYNQLSSDDKTKPNKRKQILDDVAALRKAMDEDGRIEKHIKNNTAKIPDFLK